MTDADVVMVRSRTKEGAQALLDDVCASGKFVPVAAPEPMLGRTDRWTAQAVPASQPQPPRRPASSSLEYRLRRRGHR